jgi:hypothetical protein
MFTRRANTKNQYQPLCCQSGALQAQRRQQQFDNKRGESYRNKESLFLSLFGQNPTSYRERRLKSTIQPQQCMTNLRRKGATKTKF